MSASIPTAPTDEPLLVVEDLRTYFRTDQGLARAVDGVSFRLDRGKTLAIVGESGSGKTVTALSILRLLPMPPGEIVSGRILLDDRDLIRLSERQMRRVRGGQAAMIFQEPATSLNPVYTVGNQIAESIRLHRDTDKVNVRDEATRLLREVGVGDAERRLRQYPHELSGGMKQRVMTAMALAGDPELLIADEPTTALDVTIQARILELLRNTQERRRMTLLLITHDLGVVAEMADDVVVMYAGQIVEQAGVRELFGRSAHPYTRGLFASLPRVDRDDERLQAIEGTVPSPTHFPTGCRFKDRCSLRAEKCDEEPPLIPLGEGHLSRCWFAEEIHAGRMAEPHPSSS